MERIAVIMGKMHSGGKKNLVMEYYRHIDRTKIQFDFICDDDSNAIPVEEIESLGGRVYIIPRYQNIFANIKAIKKICRENNYRIVHAYNGTMNVFGLYAAWREGVPIRINESISMAHKSDKKTVIKNILKPFSRCFSTHYMANGDECGKWQFGRLYDEGKVTIFKTVINTIDNTFDLRVREECRKKYGIESNIVIGHIGRLTAQKNTLFIIEIFNEILKLENKARLILIGDGELREAMLEKIKRLGISEEVLYLGRREDIKPFYNAMDCFLLPSLYEGLPVVGIEAESCGLPIFFSTEIPNESSPCADLGEFIDLNIEADEWARRILTKIKSTNRTDHSQEVKLAGFDSETEAKKLIMYYEGLK
ncbi:glycosyltransferase [Oribacterium sp. WCC10]|uniref:glycosyltransferase n=1 Tax=Oribacterium sp. WCC10 TaxID=1855343 RepID=UPI0008ECDE25|nr:glycosyltransferase [Oribacterium sp. WCC10]SFG80616.1 Glycosyltransferase involved in cell wall bisynthesis [Oribacterium sp. WCC10]